MNKLTSGRCFTSLLISKLTLVINDSEYGQITNTEPFFVDISCYFEPHIAASEDEPECEEWIEIECADLSTRVTFTNEHGLTLNIARGTRICNLLNESQYEELVKQLSAENKRSMFTESLDKYYNADRNKSVSNRAKQILGFGLNELDSSDER